MQKMGRFLFCLLFVFVLQRSTLGGEKRFLCEWHVKGKKSVREHEACRLCPVLGNNGHHIDWWLGRLTVWLIGWLLHSKTDHLADFYVTENCVWLVFSSTVRFPCGCRCCQLIWIVALLCCPFRSLPLLLMLIWTPISLLLSHPESPAPFSGPLQVLTIVFWSVGFQFLSVAAGRVCILALTVTMVHDCWRHPGDWNWESDSDIQCS